MNSIPKAFHSFEHKEMTVQEFENYLKAFPYRHSQKVLKCIECGDEIIFCSGFTKGSYFKHKPTPDGHSYCSLYHEGVSSYTYESEIRKKIFQEEDISFNYEIRMINGKWSSLITIPPFRNDEIDKYEKNETVLTIRDSSGKASSIPIDHGHFTHGEIKTISLNGFPKNITVVITGNSTYRNISYTTSGFSPRTQLYSTLITQDYLSQHITNINLSKIKRFICKRLSGKVYTGKHYIVFEEGYSSLKSTFTSEEATIRELILPKELSFNYSVYDVVFRKVNKKTINFCLDRDCELSERSDAVILWPPVNSIGNYKYFRNKETMMFLSFEHNDETMDMICHGTKKILFRIDNINTNSFYVTYKEKTSSAKEENTIIEKECSEITINPDRSNYLFSSGVLIGSISGKKYTLNKKDYVLSFLNRLDYNKYYYQTKKVVSNDTHFLSLVRYSQKYTDFNEIDYKYLKSKYSDDQMINQYLDYCFEYKRIKQAAKDYLMEGKL